MRTETPAPVRLADYQPPAFLVDDIDLDFRLDPSATRVNARLSIRRNGEHKSPLVLDGVRLKPVSIAIDGRPLAPGAYVRDDEHLTIAETPDAFTLETEVEIDPSANTELEGLYISAGRFCTQCEPEGFRKITWFPDRPDVLTRFTVRIEGDQAAYPRLLSNGNLVETGKLPRGRHFAVWNDPFPKPGYLFALVAGELDELADSRVTMSGRTVNLRIYVDPGMAERATYAMDSLKRAMAWDEEVFGLEYDLDLFMVVAVRDFNFGAMENKGLNIFNASLLLADRATATDSDYARIEGVIAHEYFHNWTGDRVTCRDWFQLCLKEGLTVFRDQSFSADQRGHAVKRIEDVRVLRARQFLEDAGPLAHPVRPSSYIKIDNFYTATIYEKGAEVIRMLKTLIGDAAFRKGMDLYFERWDGHATTVEAFIQCFADVSGRDLEAFFAWYEQAGTPRVSIAQHYDEANQTLDLLIDQEIPPTPGQAEKRPATIPIAIGLLDDDGRPLSFRAPGAEEATLETVIVVDRPHTAVRLEGVAARPVLSPLRGFSAPVSLSSDAAAKDRYVLMASDPDLFNRWEAGQQLARDLILARAAGAPDEVGEERFATAMGRALADQSAEPAFKALALMLPSENDLAMARDPADPAAIHAAREALRTRLAVHLGDLLRRLHGGLQEAGEFSVDAEAAGRRALRNQALDLLAADPSVENRERALGHFRAAANMTDAMGGLCALMLMGGDEFETALEAFYTRWKDEPLVIDKWFRIQAQSPAEDALGRILGLTAHPAFDARNPNRFRALVQTFASGNPARFHDPSGAGYRFVADQVLAVDGANPNLAARLVEALCGWRQYGPDLGGAMKKELERIVETPGLSKNVLELASRALA
ncbi:MAG TPA: aminopeptidase N [Caulobacteraceae bacterium]|nr:aminopeptidase N [Caulobacteraceae bacterium]